MRPRIVVALLVAALAVYFVLIGAKAVTLFREGTVTGIGLGLAAVLLPVVGAVLVFLELRFGWRTQQLGRELAAEGGLPELPGSASTPVRSDREVFRSPAFRDDQGRGGGRSDRLARLVPAGRRLRPRR